MTTMDDDVILSSTMIGSLEESSTRSWWLVRHLPRLVPRRQRVQLGYSESLVDELVMLMLAE